MPALEGHMLTEESIYLSKECAVRCTHVHTDMLCHREGVRETSASSKVSKDLAGASIPAQSHDSQYFWSLRLRPLHDEMQQIRRSCFQHNFLVLLTRDSEIEALKRIREK